MRSTNLVRWPCGRVEPTLRQELRLGVIVVAVNVKVHELARDGPFEVLEHEVRVSTVRHWVEAGLAGGCADEQGKDAQRGGPGGDHSVLPGRPDCRSTLREIKRYLNR